jgi:hypothetical protein
MWRLRKGLRKIAYINKSPLQKLDFSPSTIAQCWGIRLQNHPGNPSREALDAVTACARVDMLSDNESIGVIAT